MNKPTPHDEPHSLDEQLETMLKEELDNSPIDLTELKELIENHQKGFGE